LRQATPARIALGRSGGSLPTREWLDFQAARAAARDAVHNPFAAEQLAIELSQAGIESVIVDSQATDRTSYLQRPDLGRRLVASDRATLQKLAQAGGPIDLALIVSDGLSALAAHRQGPPLTLALWKRLRAAAWRVGPVVVARFGRVGLEDEIGEAMAAALALMLVGERPGLGSPDSLGAYLVFGPRAGNPDARRNCVSNIRPEGLGIDAAAETIMYLLTEARRRCLSGIELKDQRAVGTPLPLPARKE
jgi:ethanolamine ammonia-lyase small subunit